MKKSSLDNNFVREVFVPEPDKIKEESENSFFEAMGQGLIQK